MKIKYIAAIFVYFTTFTLSVLIVGLPTSKSRVSSSPCVDKPTLFVSQETELQARMLKFLENDRLTGQQWTADFYKFYANGGRLNAEWLATSNLVRKMERVDCEGLPGDFCTAWQAHFNAWKQKEILLEKAVEKNTAFYTENSEMWGEINRTNLQLLDIARRHGVEFKY